MARDLLNAVAGHEQVEIRLSPFNQCLAEDLPGGALARPFGCLFWFIGHEHSRFVDLDALYLAFYFSASNCFREFLRIGVAEDLRAAVQPIAMSRGASTKVAIGLAHMAEKGRPPGGWLPKRLGFSRDRKSAARAAIAEDAESSGE